MMKNLMVLAIFVLMTLMSCNSKSPENTDVKKETRLTKMEWLEGTWEFEVDNGLFGEKWKRVNDSLFSGVGYMLIGEDTSSTETLSLELRGEKLFYVAIVSDQNDGKPVSFEMVSDEDDTFIFENKEHDYPQKITYHHTAPDELTILVEGIQDGEPSKMELWMMRMK